MTTSNGHSEGRAALAALVLMAAGCAPSGSSTSSGALGLSNHDRFFLVTGSHTGYSCDKCHVLSAPSFSAAAGGVDCLACHLDADTTPAHAGVTGYSWATASCIACHKDGSGGLPANHNTDYFPVTGTSHASVRCSECHGATKAIADITCVPCHTQAATATGHVAIPPTTTGRLDGLQYNNYQWASAFCLRCHADGQVNTIASHPSVDHGLTGEGHAPFCLTCHATVAPAGGKAWARPSRGR